MIHKYNLMIQMEKLFIPFTFHVNMKISSFSNGIEASKFALSIRFFGSNTKLSYMFTVKCNTYINHFQIDCVRTLDENGVIHILHELVWLFCVCSIFRIKNNKYVICSKSRTKTRIDTIFYIVCECGSCNSCYCTHQNSKTKQI